MPGGETIHELIEKVRAYYIELGEGASREDIYRKFVTACRENSLTEDNFYIQILKPASIGIIWETSEQENKKATNPHALKPESLPEKQMVEDTKNHHELADSEIPSGTIDTNRKIIVIKPKKHLNTDFSVLLNNYEKRIQILEEKVFVLEAKINDTGDEIPKARLLKGENPDLSKISETAFDEKRPSVDNTSIVLYSKFPDEVNGFSDLSFFDKQNGERIYEFQLQDDIGIFMISNDRKVQEYALSNPKVYLEKACEFMNVPKYDCRIETKQPGKLIKSGNHWTIQERQKFYLYDS